MEIEIKKLEPQNVDDFTELISVFAMVFELRAIHFTYTFPDK
jgi:hypothetical protein